MSQTAVKGLGIKRAPTANLPRPDESGWKRIEVADGDFATVSELNSAELAELPIILDYSQARDFKRIIKSDEAKPRVPIVQLPTRE